MHLSDTAHLVTSDGLNPEIPSLRLLEREHGRLIPHAIVSRILREADHLCGGQNDTKAIDAYTEALISSWGQYNLAVIAKAIRDGVNAGKVFGKLTYPQIAEWIQQEVGALEETAHTKHVEARR